MAKQNVFEIVTNEITFLLEKGEIPWENPWNLVNHKNLVTKKSYRGINQLLLGATECKYWVTYKQAQQLKGYVKKGAKSKMVVFWTFVDSKDEVDKDGNPKKIPLLRYYRVFNAMDCEGLEEKIAKAEENQTNEIELEADAESIIENWLDKPEIKYEGNKAYYRPANDTITLPPVKQFKSTEFYYETIFHEMIHSTGHESRLNRKSIKDINNKEESYSKEELVAELGSAFLCAGCNMKKHIENHAAYIKGWLEALKNDSRMIVYASSQAQKAANYIYTHQKGYMAATPTEMTTF